jgi:hypothetical protein
MPKQTMKYSSACQKASELSIPLTDQQEQLYQSLAASGYYWNAKEKSWEYLDQEADAPTELIRVRVWADARFVEQAADDFVAAISGKGMRLLERSEVYNCRPPKQLEARVYLSFMKEPENINQPQEYDAVLSPKSRKK